MAQEITNIKTTLLSEDVIVRAVQFFSNSRWRVQTQSSRAATFVAVYSWSSFVGGATMVVIGAILSITLIGLIFGFPLMMNLWFNTFSIMQILSVPLFRQYAVINSQVINPAFKEFFNSPVCGKIEIRLLCIYIGYNTFGFR